MRHGIPHGLHLKGRSQADGGGFGEPQVGRAERLGREPRQSFHPDDGVVGQVDDRLEHHAHRRPVGQDTLDAVAMVVVHPLAQVLLGGAPNERIAQRDVVVAQGAVEIARLQQVANSQDHFGGVERSREEVTRSQ